MPEKIGNANFYRLASKKEDLKHGIFRTEEARLIGEILTEIGVKWCGLEYETGKTKIVVNINNSYELTSAVFKAKDMIANQEEK